jgi:hypothetical protein
MTLHLYFLEHTSHAGCTEDVEKQRLCFGSSSVRCAKFVFCIQIFLSTY